MYYSVSFNWIAFSPFQFLIMQLMLNLYFYATEWDNVLFLLTLVSKNINLLRTEKSLLVLIKAKHLLLSWALNVLLYFETVAKRGDNRTASCCTSLSPTCGLSLSPNSIGREEAWHCTTQQRRSSDLSALLTNVNSYWTVKSRQHKVKQTLFNMAVDMGSEIIIQKFLFFS